MPNLSSAQSFRKGSTVVCLLIVLFLPYIMVKALTPYGSATTPDSINYLDVSYNIKIGNGPATTDDSLLPEKNYHPERTWPPLYPFIVAIFSSGVPDVNDSAKLSAGLLTLTFLFIFLILWQASRSAFAVIGSITLVITVPIITVFTYAWSESLFITLLVVCAWASIQYLHMTASPDKTKFLFLGLVTLILLALFFTRYAGICFFPLFAFLFYLDRNKRQAWSFYCLCIIAYWAIVTPYLLSSINLTGSITGTDRPPSKTHLWKNIVDLSGGAHVTVMNTWEIAVALLLVSVLIVYILQRRSVFEMPVYSYNRKTALWIVCFLAAIYFMGILIMRTSVFFDPLGMRFFAPGFPFIWILLVLTVQNVNKKPVYIVLSCLILWVSLNCIFSGYRCFLSVIKNWDTIGSPELLNTMNTKYLNFTLPKKHNKLKYVLFDLVETNSMILTDRPKIIKFQVGIETKKWPCPVSREMMQRINSMDVKPLIYLTEKESVNQFKKFCEETRCSFKIISKDDYSFIKVPILMGEDG